MPENRQGGRTIGRFDRYLLAQFLTLFGFFALVLVLIYWINRAVVLFDQLIANGQSATVFLEFSLLAIPNVIRIVLPIAAFAATVWVTNRLTSESELVVVQATGFSPWRLAKSALVFGLIAMLLASALAHFVVPAANTRLATRTAEVSENMTARLLSPGRFLHPGDGVTFYIADITPRGELKGVFFSDARKEGERTTYTSREALLIRGEVAPTLIMLDGMIQSFREDGRNLSVTRFDDLALDLGGLVEGVTARRANPGELSTGTLFAASTETQDLTRLTRDRLIAEAHERFAGALNSLVAPLIGFAALLVGGFSRFGIWRQILGAVGALIFVQMLSRAGQEAVQGNADLWPLAYLGVVAGLMLSALLLMLADRPGLLRRRRPA